MGPTRDGKNRIFPTPLEWPFWALIRPPGPQGPRHRLRHVFLSLGLQYGPFSMEIRSFQTTFSVLTHPKNRPKTGQIRASGAPSLASRAAPRSPGPHGNPPGTIRKVVPTDPEFWVRRALGDSPGVRYPLPGLYKYWGRFYLIMIF